MFVNIKNEINKTIRSRPRCKFVMAITCPPLPFYLTSNRKLTIFQHYILLESSSSMIHAVILFKNFFRLSPVDRTFRLIEFRISELLLYTINAKKQLYNSFIFLYIDYCLKLLGRTYPSNVHLVYNAEKAIRRMYNTQYIEHANNYFIELNALKLFAKI